MISRSSFRSGDDDSDDPDEDYDFDDEASFNPDDVETHPCPACGGDVYEEAPRCPHCGEYVSSTSIWSGRPLAWIVLGAIGILVVIWTLIGVF
jgi:hypothetical protein